MYHRLAKLSMRMKRVYIKYIPFEDELVEYVSDTHEIYEPGSGVSEFKIWTVTEDFSDFSDYKK